MQVCKAALRIFIKHPIYILIYIVGLTFMGVFIGMSNVDAAQTDFEEERPLIAVIDRDRSEFSEGLSGFLEGHGSMVEVEDSRAALQDATAQDRASYIMIIPEGFGKDFMASAEGETEPPIIETVVSYASVAGNMMDTLVDGYLNTARLYVSSGTASTQAEAVALTEDDMDNTADVTMVQINQSGPVSPQWILYMQYSGYTIMLSIIIGVGVVMAGFNRTEVRRRNLTSPISSWSMNLQIAAACVIIMLIAWIWVNIVGLVAFGSALISIDPQIIGLAAVSLLAFCTVPLAIGFLLGQITSNELVMNAAGNITALAMSFLGGLWVSLDLVGGGVAAIARFMPTFYYGDAITRIVGLRDYTASSLNPVFGDMGIMVLFAAAIFAIALVVGRLRVQSSDAGGNAAAERATA